MREKEALRLGVITHNLCSELSRLPQIGIGATLGYKSRQDQITLAGIKLYPHIGTSAEEKSAEQECQADLTVWGDFEAAAATDELDQSIDYCQVLLSVQETAGAREYNLLETLAYKIVRNVLQDFPVSKARIKLRKRPAGLMDQIDFVEVEVEEP
jgi:dihydroneopterin aldolase